MVSLKHTSVKYRGKMAANYTRKRVKQERWHLENAAVESMLKGIPRNSWILDAPVGQGRYCRLYDELGLKVLGVDASQEMLTYAAKYAGAVLLKADITTLNLRRKFHTAVCIRFLDLLPEDAMQATLRSLRKHTTHNLICTIRLGPKYIPKSNTATHSQERFFNLLNDLNWRIVEDVPIFNQGWHVFKASTAKRSAKS